MEVWIPIPSGHGVGAMLDQQVRWSTTLTAPGQLDPFASIL